MSCSIASPLMIIFIYSIFLLISTPTITSSSSLIEQACTYSNPRKDFGLKKCIQLLQSQPKVASAKNLFDLSVGIIESGMSKAASTHTYMESLLNESSTDPNLKGVAKDCKSAYDGVIGSLRSALSEVKIKEYQTASYDLLIASIDNIERCKKVMASKQVKDKVISSGNKDVPIYGLSAFEVVIKLDK